MKIENIVCYIETEGLEEYNQQKDLYLERTKHMSQSMWWEENSYRSKIVCKIFQNPNLKSLEFIKYAWQTIYTFEINEKYYISKAIDIENRDNKWPFYFKSEHINFKYKKGYINNILQLGDSDIDKSFNNYNEFLDAVKILKIDAKESVDGRLSHEKHIELIGDLLTGEYPKLGKLSIKLIDGGVVIYYDSIKLFYGYPGTNSNPYCAEYRWVKEGKW